MNHYGMPNFRPRGVRDGGRINRDDRHTPAQQRRDGDRVRPATGRDAREAMLYRWYRVRLRESVPGIIGQWEPRIGVPVTDWRIRRMKTRWGTCNAAARRIWLNSELGQEASAVP